MFVVFLDIDGVLNEEFSESRTPSGFTGIDDKKVKVLKKIVEHFDAKVVLTTTWKSEWSRDRLYCTRDGIYMINKLKYKGNITIYDKTEDEKNLKRGETIIHWLEKHTDVEDYIVIDDYPFDFNDYADLRKHVVKTEDGILTAHTFNADYTQSVYDTLQIIQEFK